MSQPTPPTNSRSISREDDYARTYFSDIRPREIALAAVIAEPSVSAGARNEARFELAALATPFIAYTARKYRNYPALTAEDMQSVGLEAAHSKTLSYNADLGKFVSWATDAIRTAINRHAADNAFPVRIPEEVFSGRPGREADTARAREWGNAASLEAPLLTADGTYTLGDTLVGSPYSTTIEYIDDRDEADHRAIHLHRAISTLTTNQQAYITLNLAGKSNDTISQLLGISKSGVSMLKKRAFTELAETLNGLRVN